VEIIELGEPTEGSVLTIVLTFGLREWATPARLLGEGTQPFPPKGYENQEFA
jgi:hypothetical protein